MSGVTVDLDAGGTLAGSAIFQHAEHLAADAESGVLLRALCEGAGAVLDRPRRAALGTDTLRPGQLLWDPAVAELWALRWTANLTGATIPARRVDETDDAYLVRARDEVIHVRGWRRGTPEARKAAARSHLTGDRRVMHVERYQDSVWRELIVTYTAETPDPAATLADVLDPSGAVAGVRTIYRTDPGWSVGHLEAAYAGRTIAALEADWATIGDLENHLP